MEELLRPALAFVPLAIGLLLAAVVWLLVRVESRRSAEAARHAAVVKLLEGLRNAETRSSEADERVVAELRDLKREVRALTDVVRLLTSQALSRHGGGAAA